MTTTPTLKILPTLAAALWLAASGALAADEPTRIRRIGMLYLGDVADATNWLVVRRRLNELGYVDGKNAVFEPRYAQGRAERLPELAAQLVQAKVDVIVAMTNLDL